MKNILFVTMTLALLNTANAQDEILGEWVANEGKTIVEVYKTAEGDYAGKVVWLEQATNEDGEPYKDRKNPDKKLRDREILGLDLLENLEYKEGKWLGTLYSPKKGRTVDAELSVNGKDLDIKVFFRSFSRKVVWTRNELSE